MAEKTWWGGLMDVARLLGTSVTRMICKELEFPVMVRLGLATRRERTIREEKAARMFYVAATKATQRLMNGVGGVGDLGGRWVDDAYAF